MLLTLPQETLNEIVALLRDEERALQSLSLVDRMLTDECRRYLFRSINIDSEEKLQRWNDAIPPGKDGLSRYVRILDIQALGLPSKRLNLQDNLTCLCSFTEVEHLKIRELELYLFSIQDLERYFGHFPAVRSISIWKISGYTQDIPNFLPLFPRLETTVITSPDIGIKIGSVDVHFTNFVYRGDFILKLAKIDAGFRYERFGTNLLSCLTSSTMRYRRLGFALVTVDYFSPLELFLRACGDSVEVIQFVCCVFCEYQVHLPFSSH